MKFGSTSTSRARPKFCKGQLTLFDRQGLCELESTDRTLRDQIKRDTWNIQGAILRVHITFYIFLRIAWVRCFVNIVPSHLRQKKHRKHISQSQECRASSGQGGQRLLTTRTSSLRLPAQMPNVRLRVFIPRY